MAALGAVKDESEGAVKEGSEGSVELARAAWR
jgi:hypothetical protein